MLTGNECKPYPTRIAIFGGGRWARVLIEVLCELVPFSTAISVHSRHNTNAMTAWAHDRGLSDRFELSSEWPRTLSTGSNAVIVANAARDHYSVVEWALSAGFPTLVEKPIALTSEESQRLADLARNLDVPLAAAQVFLFARYLENFSNFVIKARPIKSLHIDWTDPSTEKRYGEQKRYDPSLSILSDWLPHIIPLIQTLLPRISEECQELKVLRGGALVELKLKADGTPCTIRLERNASQRKRVVQVLSETDTFTLDFSTEPGRISQGNSIRIADPYWEVKRRPVACMLSAFLEWAAGGKYDPRLDINLGLQACRTIDQATKIYQESLQSWYAEQLNIASAHDEDLRYALTEMKLTNLLS